MSTVPTAGVPPGLRLDAVRIAEFAALSYIDSVPALNVLAGFAEAAVKSAPEATVTPTATSTVASVARVRRGCRVSGARRVMELPGRIRIGNGTAWEPSRLEGAREGAQPSRPSS